VRIGLEEVYSLRPFLIYARISDLQLRSGFTIIGQEGRARQNGGEAAPIKRSLRRRLTNGRLALKRDPDIETSRGTRKAPFRTLFKRSTGEFLKRTFLRLSCKLYNPFMIAFLYIEKVSRRTIILSSFEVSSLEVELSSWFNTL
jgi:hypothetical protein